MNILVIVHEFPPGSGGGGVHALGMVQEMSASHTVTVITPRRTMQPFREHHDNYTIIRVPTLGQVNAETQTRLQAYIAFLSFIITGTLVTLKESTKNKFDCIHSYFALPAGLIGMITGWICTTPHVVTLIEADLLDPASECTRPYTGVLRAVLSSIIRTSTACTAISRNIADVAKTHYNSTRDIVLINPGIPATTLKEHNNTEKEQTENVTIISIGRLVARKDFYTLIAAFAQMSNHLAQLVIVGDGPLRKNLSLYARKIGVAERVVFTGHISEEEKQQQLRAADIFALTSRHEGFGIVIAEALNCSLPVVTTDSGGQSELVIHQKNGFLAPTENIRIISQYLDTLASDPELRSIFSSESARIASKFYNSTIAASYLRLFESSIQ